MPSIVIVGGGPRGVGVLERLGANIELFPGELDIHLVDPFPVGAGRVWRYEQSPLLRMNSMAEDVTMFTDESVVCDGPVKPGPSLSQWAQGIRDGTIRKQLPDDVRDEVETLVGTAFPTRRLQSAYLSWFYEHTLAGLPSTIKVHVHQDIATKITDDPQTVWLSKDGPLRADIIVVTVGHVDNESHQDLKDYADEHGLFYLPPAYSADVDLSGIHPGQDVLMRGFGLAFVDLMVLLTEGRGGKYRTEADGTLTYLPSGEEPRLIVGSRRGVPYHAKTNYRLKAGRPPLPQFFTPQALDRGELDFRTDVWPLMAKDIAWGYYHELFNAHPDRVTVTWSDFAERFSESAWGSGQMRALVNETVPSEQDRLDFEALDRPMTGRFATPEALQDHMRTLIRQDIDRRESDHHSQDLGAFMGLLSTFGGLAPLAASGKLTTTALVRDVAGWWQGFFNLLASGPPGHRLEELLALSRAGIVQFLGADMQVTAQDGVFTATTSSHPRAITTQALVEARLPKPRLTGATDELVRWLNNTATPEVLHNPTTETGRLVVTPADLRIVDRAGRPHPTRFALGPLTNVVAATAFARPHTNAPAFRQNDAVARAILRTL